jgi:hypothetical protein
MSGTKNNVLLKMPKSKLAKTVNTLCYMEKGTKNADGIKISNKMTSKQQMCHKLSTKAEGDYWAFRVEVRGRSVSVGILQCDSD